MSESTITINGQSYHRLHIKTHVVVNDDDIFDVVDKYIKNEAKPSDWVFISERVVAITQGRAYKISDIKVGPLAKFLVKFVYKSPYGIGLGRPETMQLAINEAGGGRILVAAVIGGLAKLFGFKGIFYVIAGNGVNAIDGPCDYTLPPYNNYAVLGPKKPNELAQKLTDRFGMGFVIIDANDLGVNVLGASSGIDRALAEDIFRDNPLGQSSEQTPMAIVSKAHKA